MSFTKEELQDMINCLLDLEEGLTEYEITFLDNIKWWLSNNVSLTDKQSAFLVKLYDKHS
tara:strand:- start:454 stop:633 length:180 start_codon:yes stop_codon:yes gene_type:complete